jgi:hypothetical protein
VAKIPVLPNGPPLGNVPTPDFYVRLKQNIESLQAGLSQVNQTANTPQALSADQLSQIQKALTAGGSNVLNLTALPGILLQPQNANIPEVTKLPSVGNSTDGQVVLYRKVIWRFSGKTKKWTPASTILLLDYSFNLGLYPAASYAPGVLFYAVNTGTLYIEQDLTTGAAWVPALSETVVLPHVDRTSSGAVTSASNNTSSALTWASGEHFRAEMVNQQIWFNNNIWPVTSFSNNNLIVIAGNTNNANGNYIFEYPSINYPVGGLFLETDRNVIYYAGNASGAVSVAANNNNVAWVSGQLFDVYWNNIQIGNNVFGVASVAQNRLALVTTSPAGNGNNLAYFVPSGSWFYGAGGFASTLNNIPADLSSVDQNYHFEATDVYHAFRWTGNNWDFAPGDPGSAYIVGSIFMPLGGLWALCDGANANVTTPAGGVSTIATPNLTGEVFLKGGNFTGVQQAANRSTWAPGAATDLTGLSGSGNAGGNFTTDTEALHTHGVDFLANATTINSGLTGTPTIVVTGVQNNSTTTAGSPHAHNFSLNNSNVTISPNPHSHNLSNNNAVLNAPSENNGGLPLRYALTWYMRR